MPTPQELEAQGILKKLEVELDPDEQPQRLIYALPRVIKWMTDELPNLSSDGYFPDAPSPAEQTETLLYQVIVGKNSWEMAPKCLRPELNGIWELRTFDLRFFGWFWKRGIFIMSAVETKEKCIRVQGLYYGHKTQSQRDRELLDLDSPKFITGSKPEDVL